MFEFSGDTFVHELPRVESKRSAIDADVMQPLKHRQPAMEAKSRFHLLDTPHPYTTVEQIQQIFQLVDGVNIHLLGRETNDGLVYHIDSDVVLVPIETLPRF